MFRIEILPAAHGDCLWIEYGSGTRIGRILVDGGPAHTYPALRERILHLPAGERTFELFIITHIDADHIEGAIRLLADAEALHCRFERIWFNGREQLNKVFDPAGEPLGALQGEMLGMLIHDYERRVGATVCNAGCPDGVAAVDRHSEKLPAVDLCGDCRVTLLSPDAGRLLDLKDRWRDELRKARVPSGDEYALRAALDKARHLQPLGDVLGDEVESIEDRFELPDGEGRDLAAAVSDALGTDEGGEPGDGAPFGSDESRTNGSSIAVLVEYPKEEPEVRILLAGDAWPSVVEASVEKLLSSPGQRLSVDAFKVPHHGSVANLSASLLRKLRCDAYLVSTSGAVFRHPHARAIELLLAEHRGRGKPRLHFNYVSETTAPWITPGIQKERRFAAFHPKGLSLSL